ncbi:MAG: hypothetical protein O7I42_22910 [Alphaproteobacteria bacterium]|nr:hypothetical protein [Alphaproteobacteria bacterium]
MAGSKAKLDQATEADTDRKNERSTIAFPYIDLDSAVNVAQAMYEWAGHGVSEIDELAAKMDQTVSGAFRLKISSARMFGLLDKAEPSGLVLSQLGQEVVQLGKEARARSQAFLNIPLYFAIYEKYRGHLLPPAKALEREMAALGVASKQTDKARRIFERSARQAEFFAQGDDRLVQPRFDRAPDTKPLSGKSPPRAPEPSYGGFGGNVDGGSTKPLEYQLIDLLNEPMSDEVQQAIWTLIQFLKSPKQGSESPEIRATHDAPAGASDD